MKKHVQILLLLICICPRIQAQDWRLRLKSNVQLRTWKLTYKAEVEETGLSGALVALYSGSTKLTQVMTDENGDFLVEVPPNGDFILTVTYPNCNTKKFAVSTRGVPEKISTDNFKPSFGIGGFIMARAFPGIDYSALETPLVRVVYSERIKNFNDDKDYTNQMLGEISKISQAENTLIEQFTSTNKMGDDALKRGDCPLARACYQKAMTIIPGELYPKEQLEKVGLCLKDKEDIAKKAAEEAAAKEAAAKAAADKATADKLAAEQAAKEKAEADKQAKEKLAAEQLAKQKEKEEADRLAKEKLAAEQATKLKEKEEQRLAAEKAAAEKAEADKAAKEKLAAEQATKQKEKDEADRLAKEKLAAEQLAKQKEKEEQKLVADKAAKEKAEADKLAAEKAAKEKEESQKLAADKAAKQKADAAAIAKAKADSDKQAKEKQAAENAARQKAKDEQKLAADKAAKEKADQLAAEKAAKDKADLEARNKAESDRKAKEKESAIVAKPFETPTDNGSSSTNKSDTKYKVPQVLGANPYKDAITKADGYMKMKRYQEAKEAYETALKAKPEDPYATKKLAEVNTALAPK